MAGRRRAETPTDDTHVLVEILWLLSDRHDPVRAPTPSIPKKTTRQ
jgi:hypothetical protein